MMNTRRTLDRMMEDNDVNKNIPPKVEKLEQVFMLLKVIESLMWTEVMMWRWFPGI